MTEGKDGQRPTRRVIWLYGRAYHGYLLVRRTQQGGAIR